MGRRREAIEALWGNGNYDFSQDEVFLFGCNLLLDGITDDLEEAEKAAEAIQYGGKKEASVQTLLKKGGKDVKDSKDRRKE